MRELVEQARAGDHGAFTSLVTLSIDRMYATAYLIVRDRARAEDAVQEAFMRAWRDLAKLRDPDRFDPWLRRLLINACYDLVRRQPPIVRQADASTATPSIADFSSQVVHRDALARAFGQLSAEHRAVIVLTQLDGLTTRETAEVLGIPQGTVKSRLHHALRALRAAMDADARPPARSERSTA